MRTTLTIDDDIAVRLERLRRDRDASLKEVVNEVLRRGLENDAEPKPRKPLKMKTYNMGEAKFPIDNVAEALAFAEGEDFK